MNRDARHVSDLAAGTLVLLPSELGRFAGYAEGEGSTRVMVPGHKSLDAYDLPPLALVEVIAEPHELANAYLRGELARVDRRWRGSRRARRTEGARFGEAGAKGEAA